MRSVIPNSDDMDCDEDPPSGKESSITTVQHVLKRVVIPTSNRTSIGSSLSSVRDHSSEYDTPATSAVATPAESFVRERTLGSQLKASGRLDRGKRKRAGADDQLEADAALARSLQEREYDEEPKPGRTSRGARQGLVNDSDEGIDELFATSYLATANISDADVPLSRRTKPDRLAPFPPPDRPPGKSLDRDDDDDESLPRRKRVKPALRASLPSRAARTSATKSLKDSGSRLIQDSDDSELSELSDTSSDASVFESEVDSDDMEDSDEVGGDDGEGLEEHGIGTTAESSTIVADATITPARRRGRRGAAQQNNVRRRQRRRFRNRYFDSRVSSVCFKSTIPRLMSARRSESATSLRHHTQRSRLCGRI